MDDIYQFFKEFEKILFFVSFLIGTNMSQRYWILG